MNPKTLRKTTLAALALALGIAAQAVVIFDNDATVNQATTNDVGRGLLFADDFTLSAG